MSGSLSKFTRHMVILPCSGPCNVGLIAHQTAVELTREGTATMLNLAGIAAHRSTFLDAARELAKNMMVLDGCSVGCARTGLHHVDIQPEGYLVVTDLGIEKSDDFNLRPEDIAKVKNALRELVPRVEAGLPLEKPKCLCAEEW